MSEPESVCYEFGGFRLKASQRLLFRNGQLVSLPPKGLEILVALVENHGELLEKEDLMKRVWRDCFVEDSNLAVHISQLRKTLSEQPNFYPIETIPKRGYRFTGVVRITKNDGGPPSGEIAPGFASSSSMPSPKPEPEPLSGRHPILRSTKAWMAAITLLVLVAGSFESWRSRRAAQTLRPAVHSTAPAPRPLTEKGRILLADIQNETGQSVFDSAIRQGLAMQLDQSPFLSLVSDQQVQSSLKLMEKPANVRLTPEVAWDLCQRTGSDVMIYGSIGNLGNQYILGLHAVNCITGESLFNEQVTADGAGNVLKAVDGLATKLRGKLGESFVTIQKHNVPIEEATTASLAGLEAYSIGRLMMIRRDDSAGAIPFFQRAVDLDPNFATAYAALGNAYSNIDETGKAAECLRKAYALRQKTSDRERFYIESHYDHFVTGNLEKARQVYQQWAETYPRDVGPRTNIAVIDSFLGRHDRSLAEATEALDLSPDDAQSYANLMDAYIYTYQLDKAKSLAQMAQSRNLDSPEIRKLLYDIAFLRNDDPGIKEQVSWAAGQAGIEDDFLNHEALRFAYFGQLDKARGLSDRALRSAIRSGDKETAAGFEVNSAQREAFFGNSEDAKHHATAALALANDRDTEYGAALAFAIAGDSTRASQIANTMGTRFPEDTVVQFCYLPTIEAALALNRKNPARAIQTLEVTRPYELGTAVTLYPVYFRGLAYLGEQKSAEAIGEFQKILDTPGVVTDDPIAALSWLQLARGYTLSGDIGRAKPAYQHFLNLWKDADADIPILKQAKAEYDKL